MAAYQLPIPEMFQLQGKEHFPKWRAHLHLHLLMADNLRWIEEDLPIEQVDGTCDIKLRKERARVALFILSNISQPVFEHVEENRIGYTNEEAFWLYYGLVALYDDEA